MTSASSAKPPNNGILTVGILAALVVATGAPDAETVAALTERGVPASIATPAMYVIPVLALIAALLIGRAIGRGRTQFVRWSIYALFGALGGFVLGMCLELFAAVPNVIEAIVGPLATPTLLDEFLWILGGTCIALGAMTGGVALFGQSAMTALQVEDVSDPECLEVRRAERGVFGLSSLGMITLGVACCALAVARQTGDGADLGPTIVAFAAGLGSVAASYLLWRGFDEMQRRHVVDGYATSAIVVTLGAFVWCGLEAISVVPPLSSAGVFLAMIFVQLIATSYVTSSVMGQTSMFGKPA